MNCDFSARPVVNWHKGIYWAGLFPTKKAWQNVQKNDSVYARIETASQARGGEVEKKCDGTSFFPPLFSRETAWAVGDQPMGLSEGIRMRGKKIQLVLVADARRRRWLKDILQTGFVFLEACDVNEAVGLIRQKRRVDAIIVAPSRGRGLTTLRRLHADPLCHHIPLALLLENASAEAPLIARWVPIPTSATINPS